jgi:hypothetical protein
VAPQAAKQQPGAHAVSHLSMLGMYHQFCLCCYSSNCRCGLNARLCLRWDILVLEKSNRTSLVWFYHSCAACHARTNSMCRHNSNFAGRPQEAVACCVCWRHSSPACVWLEDASSFPQCVNHADVLSVRGRCGVAVARCADLSGRRVVALCLSSLAVVPPLQRT